MKKNKIIVINCIVIFIIIAFGIEHYKTQSIFQMYNFNGYIKIDEIIFHQNLEDNGIKISINDDQNKKICDILQDTSFRKTFWKSHENEPKRFDIYFRTIHSDGSFYVGELIYCYPNGKVFNTREHFNAILGKGDMEGNLYQQLESILFKEE